MEAGIGTCSFERSNRRFQACLALPHRSKGYSRSVILKRGSSDSLQSLMRLIKQTECSHAAVLC